jgi:hypothetical protein
MAIVQIRGLIEYQWEFVAEKRAGGCCVFLVNWKIGGYVNLVPPAM